MNSLKSLMVFSQRLAISNNFHKSLNFMRLVSTNGNYRLQQKQTPAENQTNNKSDSQSDDGEEGITLVNRHFLTLRDFTNDELKTFLWTAMDLKKRIKEKKEVFQPLKGKNLAMIFEKRSTRTRMSSESGFSILGGHPLFLTSQDIHLGVNESLADSARVISRFADIILARVYSHDTLLTLAKEGGAPVVSGLCDKYHPLQILADFITLQEYFGRLKGLNVAWVGDGNNNVTHSFMMGCPKMGMNLRVAAPKGYEVNKQVAFDADQLCKENSTAIHYTNDPREAVEGCDVVVTDTWVSMGAEEEKSKRLKDFHGFQVTKSLCSLAKPSHAFLHCLPRKPEEVTDEVFYSPNSLVWDEAENRKWTVMSVLLHLLQDYKPAYAQPKF